MQTKTPQTGANARLPQEAVARKRLQGLEPMSLRPLCELSFFHPEFADPKCLESGTFPWLLERYESLLFPSWIFKGWHGEKPGRGRSAWAAPVLAKLLLLRWSDLVS